MRHITTPRPRRRALPAISLLGAWLLLALHGAPATGAESAPLRIVLTNDDGIEAVASRLLPVAERLRSFAEVFVVVADRDRSGTGSVLSVTRQASVESRLEHVSEAKEGKHRLEVHSVAGYPADCVVLAVYGIVPGGPDLVVSGPNGGPNLAYAWFGSGTIGAARTAAFLGIPAIAVSGLDDDAPAQVAALADWVAALARTDAVLGLAPGSYLTVGVPRLPPEEIRGIRIARRAGMIDGFTVRPVARSGDADDEEEVTTVWTVELDRAEAAPPPTSDVALYEQGYVVVTPMRADEHDTSALEDASGLENRLPDWPAGTDPR